MISDKPLPPGWCESPLPQVAQINPGHPTESPGEDTVVSFVPMASVEPLSGRLDPREHRVWREVKKGYTRFQDGDVLFAKITPCMENGKAAIARGLSAGIGAGSTEFHVLRPGPAVRPELLLHYVLQEEFRKTARAHMTGTAGQLRVPSRFLDEQTMPVPPVQEQRRIVEAIESYLTRLDAAVATLERVQRNLKRYRASVLKAAVEGRLVPTEAELARAEGRDYEPASVLLERILAERRRRWEEAELARMKAKGKAPKGDKWRAKYKEPVAPDTEDLPDLPEGWCWASIEQLASSRPRSIQSGPFGSNLLHSEFQASGRLVVGIDNVQDGYFSIGSEHRISESKFRALDKYRARAGDVLVTVMATIGRCCVIPDDLEPAIITKHVYRISTQPELASPRYLHLALWGGPIVRDQMLGKAQGQTRPGLNGTIIKQLCVPIPPRSEQDRIVTEADRLLSIGAESSSALTATTQRCTRLRQSILKWAFEGRLVDQDPTDEPASRLLERIQAERGSTNREPRRSLRRPRARSPKA